MTGDGTHNKKQRLNRIFTAKGMTPIEKNVNVVDEQGNTYEATYPKRAKGLCKNGRARFIDENTICLACPPIKETEDNKMSENIIVEEVKIDNVEPSVQAPTAKEIFDKIVELQKQLTESSFHSLHRLEDAITSICDNEAADNKSEQIKEVCSVFKMRENTLTLLLETYRKMYDDQKSDKPLAREGVASEMVKTLNDPNASDSSKAYAAEILQSYMTALN